MKTSRSYFISIGSNFRPEIHIRQCLERLRKEFGMMAVSSIYETPPFGPSGPDRFWNLAAKIESSQPSGEIKSTLRKIENAVGGKRNPGNKYAPRAIDLDLLPTNDYLERPYVMIPLAEIAPNERDPLSQISFSAAADACRENAQGFRKIAPEGIFTLR